jgi:hypothetical protein
MNICHICGIPQDAGFFDDSDILPAPAPGQELVLARYELHRNYCGMLLYFAQYVKSLSDASTQVTTPQITTPGYQWQIRCNGQPRAPYLAFDHIINPWGLSGFPIYLRLEEGCLLEFVIRNVGASGSDILDKVGGRLLGRYWYNDIYGGASKHL